MSLKFWPWTFQGSVAKFYGISKGKETFILSKFSKGKVTKLKDPGFFFWKGISSILDSSGNAQPALVMF